MLGPSRAGGARQMSSSKCSKLNSAPLRFGRAPGRFPTAHVPAALAGGGNGGSLGGGNSGGGGGGGGDNSGGKSGGGGAGAAAFPLLAGWRDRVAYDPEFPFKVLLEQIIGVGASVIGDMSSRPNWGLNELDFVFATLVVGSVVNFSLMYLLAPTAAAAAGAKSGLAARLLSDEFLKKWGAPGGNMFEKGYAVGPRLVNFAYKGATFAVIGMLAGIVGTSISNGLLALRQKLDPAFVSQNEAPSVIGNAACWSLHMGLSSNLRYQVLGGADAVLIKAMPLTAFRLYSAVIRALNNAVGGISFVIIARMFGVQKAAAPADAAPAKGKKGGAAAKGKKPLLAKA